MIVETRSEDRSSANQPIRPQGDAFDMLIRLKKIGNILLYVIFGLSIALPFINSTLTTSDINFKFIFKVVFVVIIVSFAILTFIVDYYLFPTAERTKRADFIDNSFGSKYNLEPSDGYFSNDEFDSGIYKASVNLFESCFFTCSIAKKMWAGRIIKSSVFTLVVVILAVVGFQDNQYAIPVLQFFLSAAILGDLIKFYFFMSRNDQCFVDLQSMFADDSFKRNARKYMHRFVKIYADYESNLSWAMLVLDGKIYSNLNSSLSAEWEKIKQKYGI